ncbi:aspartic peptidase A1 [Suillus spraguei]|nr:aspartic peptidase A1 [Suillus spraguei]
MFSVIFLFPLLAFSVTGLPVEVRDSPITLPITSRLAFSNITDLLRHDEARLVTFEEYSMHDRRDDAVNTHPKVPLFNADLGNTFSGYTVKAAIGNPPTVYNLILDSASAITWIGANIPPISGSGEDTEKRVAVNYRYGSFEGIIAEDDIYFTDDIAVRGMEFGLTFTPWRNGADGVLGIGPTLSGLGALLDSPEQTLPTITDRLCQQGIIRRSVVGILFQPITANIVNRGELTFGGTSPTMYSPPIGYTDITTTAPSSRYWGINQKISYGSGTGSRNPIILDYTAGIVDCGTTFLYLAIGVYSECNEMQTGGVVNPANGLLQISLYQYDALRDLNFHIGRYVYKLIPNAQIWPRSLNKRIEGGDDEIYLVVKALTTPTGAGYDFINGYVFLQRFYTVFDSGRHQVGFALNVFTHETPN